MNEQGLSVDAILALKKKGGDISQLLSKMSPQELASLQAEINSQQSKAQKYIYDAKKAIRKAQAEMNLTIRS